MKKCSKCGIQKPLSEFYKDNSRKDKHQTKCKPCHENVKFKSKVGAYGISVTKFYEILDEQNHKCCICEEDLITKKHRHIDHDHKTGKVRGILCHHCNTAIGLFKENVNIMKQAIDYISHHENENSQIIT